MSLADLHAIRDLRLREALLFESVEPAPDAKKIVLYSADPWKLGVVEQCLHLAFQLKGHRPVSIYYDGFTPISPWENHCTAPPPPEQLVKRYGFIFECFGIQGVAMSAYLDREETWRHAEAIIAAVSDDALKTLVYRGLPIGRLALRDLFQFTHGHFDAQGPEAIALYSRHLIHAVVSVDLAHAIIDQERPDIVVLVCGKAVMYSYMYEVCRQREVQATTWEEGMYFDDSIVLANNGKAIDFPVGPEIWQRYREIPLEPEQDQAVAAYFEKWRNQTATFYVYYERENRDFPAMMESMGLPAETPVISLFPNIIWDTNALGKDRAFDSMFDWICATIDFVRDRDCALLIRAHPGEVRLATRTRTPIKDLLAARYGSSLPSNLRIIDSTSEFSSYEIARNSRQCAVYTSTLGIELSLMGLRPLICGVPFYADKGITNDIADRDEYFDILSGRRAALRVDSDVLKRFLHLVVFRLVKRLEFLVGIYDHPQQPRIHMPTFAGFPESMPVFDGIVEQILANGNFIDPIREAVPCAL